MQYFSTYFDINYLPRGLALYHSLVKFCKEVTLFVLCMDDDSYYLLKKLGYANIVIVPLTQLETNFPSLTQIKDQRSKVEYYWTCGPSFISYVLKNFDQIDLLTDLDADMLFYSDNSPVLKSMEGMSIGITEHRFSKRNIKRLKFGKYNVGWSCFRRDAEAIKCVDYWSAQCIEWCYDVLEDGRYGDQKYLDEWPSRFKNVKIIKNKGVNLAPWNIDNCIITARSGQIFVDGELLVCFHFHGFKEITPWLYDSKLGRSGISPSRTIRREIFGTYLQELIKYSTGDNKTVSLRKPRSNDFILKLVKTVATILCSIFSRSYLVVFRGKVV